MKRKLLFTLIALLAAITSAQADGTYIDGLFYNLNATTQTASVTYQDYNSSSNSSYVSGDLVIPETVTYNGTTYSVTSIGYSAFSGCRSLTSVTIPNSVTSIGNSAFSGCSGLTSITIPNSVTSIGEYTFSGCSGLTNITIPNRVTSIGTYTFRYCSSLTSVTIGNSVTSIGNSAFSSCSSLTSVTIPNSVTSIGSEAFYNCRSLTSVTIPNSVTSIGNNAFYNVPNIVYSGSATGAPWGAKNMNGYVDGYWVYSDDTKTTLLACSAAATGEITIPNSVTSIGRSAFDGCSSLTSVTIPESVTSMGDWAFCGCSSLTSITIPNSVTSIGSYAFYSCENLASIILPSSITIINTYTFRNCSSLTSIKIPITVTEIESEAFEDCTSLKEVVFPNSVKKIGNYAFRRCSDLEILTVGSGLTSAETKIGGYVFDKCNKLKEVYFVSESPSSQSSVNKVDYKGTFKINDFTKFYIPCGASNAYSLTLGFGGTEYSGKGVVRVESSDTIMGNVSIIHQANCDDIAVVEAVPTDGNYFLRWSDGTTESYYSLTINKDTLLKAEFYAIGTGSGRCGDNLYWTLADGNLFITGSGAMYDYTEETQPWYKMKDYIRSVSFPADITTIGDYAFYGCKNLTSVTIPQNVTVIGDYSFAECTALERVVIGAGVTSIRCGAFYNDWRIEEITCYPVLVPEVCENSFYNVSNLTYLYVQSDRMRQYQLNPYLKGFDIRPIGATEVNSSTGVTVIPSERDAQFTWPANGNASSYTLQITKNGEVFCTLVFNEYGQLTGIAFAPARNGEQHPRQAATATANGWQFTVTGLNEGSAYAYTLDVKDAANNVLNSYNGTFQTTGTPNSIDTPNEIGDGLTSHARKVIENGNVYILLPDGRKLNMQGAEVK